MARTARSKDTVTLTLGAALAAAAAAAAEGGRGRERRAVAVNTRHRQTETAQLHHIHTHTYTHAETRKRRGYTTDNNHQILYRTSVVTIAQIRDLFTRHRSTFELLRHLSIYSREQEVTESLVLSHTGEYAVTQCFYDICSEY